MLSQIRHVIMATVFENIFGTILWSLVGVLSSSSVRKVHGGKADESSPVSESLVREQGRGIWRLELGLHSILEAG